jgi:predicted RNA binding protein YcfA (HicA-like mRNA interferase family)
LAKLPKLTGNEVGKVATKLGFIHTHTTGSHMVFKHPDGRKATIPHHAGEEIGPGLLTKIIKKDLQVTREEFFGLLQADFSIEHNSIYETIFEMKGFRLSDC